MDDILYTSGQEDIETAISEYGMAVNFMSFSENNKYLMIYYQTIDNFQLRVNKSQGQLLIFNLESRQWLKSWDNIYDQMWTAYNFPNILMGKFFTYKNQLSPHIS